MLRSRISVFALQAGNQDEGNLIKVLSTLATETGGEFYRAKVRSEEIRSDFSRDLKRLLRKSIADGDAAVKRLSPLSPLVREEGR